MKNDVVFYTRYIRSGSPADACEIRHSPISLGSNLSIDKNKIYGLLRRLQSVFTVACPRPIPRRAISPQYEKAVSNLEDYQFRHCHPIETTDADIQTIFPTFWSHTVSNIKEPWTRTGIEIAKLSIGTMHEASLQQSARLIFLLLPSKPSVYWNNVKASAIDDANAAQQISEIQVNQRGKSRRLEVFFRPRGIEVLDPYDTLLASGAQACFESTEGHLTVAGNQVIAKELAKFLHND